MKVKHNGSTATFEFWTPLSPIDRFIGLKLHEKYPTLSFALRGCDEFESMQKPIWSVDAEDCTDPRLAQKEARLSKRIHELFAIATFASNFGEEDFWRTLRADAEEIFEGDLAGAQLCVDRTMETIRQSRPEW
jgi:hypothetical protein